MFAHTTDTSNRSCFQSLRRAGRSLSMGSFDASARQIRRLARQVRRWRDRMHAAGDRAVLRSFEPLENRVLLSVQTVTAQAVDTTVDPGAEVVINVDMTTDTPNSGGLNLHIHFNSDDLIFDDFQNPASAPLPNLGTPQADSSDLDGDASTDMYIITSWLDFSGAWPGTTAVSLYDAMFTTAGDFSGSTTVRFSHGDVAQQIDTVNLPSPITIQANEPELPTLSISDVTLAEGDDGTTAFEFTVSLSSAPSSNVDFDINTSDGSATVAGGDYQALISSGTFTPAGPLTQTFTVQVNGDEDVEQNETFQVGLSNVSGPAELAVGGANATGTITNDDTLPTFSIDNVTLEEGDGGATNFVFTVSLDKAPVGDNATVLVNTQGGTATAGDDYTAVVDQELTFTPGGGLTQTVTVPVIGDTEFEGTETFNVVLSGAVNATIDDDTGVGTISEDDVAVPDITIADVDISEGDSGTSTLTFTVSLSGTTTVPVSVDYATASGSATSGADFVAASGTVTIPAGMTSGTFDVQINGDEGFENDETFTVNLSNAVNGNLVDTSATGTINNDDGAPSFSISDVSQVEGDSGTTSFIFDVTLTGTITSSVSVTVDTDDGTATAGVDYTTFSDVLTFDPAGPATQTVTVVVNGDEDVESDETFTVELSSPTGIAVIADGTATGTIENDDQAAAVPDITIGDVSMVEGDSGTTMFTFTVNLSESTSEDVSVDWSTTNGTAVAGSDYTADSDTLVIGAGNTSGTFSVVISGDTDVEPDETFTVTLSNASGGSITDSSATGTIENDDQAAVVPDITIADTSIAEGDSGTTFMTFTVSLSEATTEAVSVNWATANGTALATSDYEADSDTLTIAAGLTSGTFTVAINGDTDIESDETFFVNLSSAVGGTITDATASGTIENDDQEAAEPDITIGDVSIAEGDSGTTMLTFTVNLSESTDQDVTVDWATTNGTALDGSDYTADSDTLTIAAGNTSGTFSVLVTGDTEVESDETFTVTLSNASGGTITDGTATGTIENDDEVVGMPNVTISDASVTEGDSGTTMLTFTVNLSSASDQDVTVDWATTNGTALAGSDYTADSDTLTIAAGNTSGTFSVLVTGDTDIEPDETFTVTLSNASGGTITDATATGTIENDDVEAAVPDVSISDASIAEGDSGTTMLTFTVNLSSVSDQDVTVDWVTSNGTALATEDYVAAGDSLTIAAGASSGTFTILINGDTAVEADETFTVTLSNAVNGTITDATATGTIENDDAEAVVPEIAVGDATVVEGDSGQQQLVFTITLSEASDQDVSVDWAATNGTALAGSDYTAASDTLTIAAGDTSGTITILVDGDEEVEPDETLSITLSNAVNGTIVDATATGTIENDDEEVVVPDITIADASIVEGDDGTQQLVLTVSLSEAATQDVSVNWSTTNGTALAGSDFEADSGTLTITAGDTSGTISITIQGDSDVEPDETFTVNLSGATGGTITDAVATVTISNDDEMVLLGSIAGVAFLDLDGDGNRDGGEAGLAGVTVFLDANANGVLDGGELEVTTSAGGAFLFSNLLPDDYNLRYIVPDDHAGTSPAVQVIDVESGEDVTGIVVGADPDAASLSGVKFTDLNVDGDRDGGEPGQSGVTIYLDANNNGVLDTGEISVVTGAGGSYSFEDLDPGTYIVREQTEPGMFQTTPAAGFYSVNLSAGEDAGGLDFGNAVSGTISGQVFVDENADGDQDAGEEGLAGFVVFVDLNGNGILDGDEPSDTTDVNGTYVLEDVPEGTHDVLIVTQAGFIPTGEGAIRSVTVDAGVETDDIDFGNREGEILAPGANGLVQWIDADGTQIVAALVGAGNLSIVEVGAGLYDVLTTGTTLGSRLHIVPVGGGNGDADIGGIAIDNGAIGVINAGNANLSGDLDIAEGTALSIAIGDMVAADQQILIGGEALNVVTLVGGHMQNTSLISDSSIRAMQVQSWENAGAGAAGLAIMAPSLGAMRVLGSFDGDVELTGDPAIANVLGNVIIHGTLSGQWDLAGNAGNLQAANLAGFDLSVDAPTQIAFGNLVAAGQISDTTVNVDGSINAIVGSGWTGGSVDAMVVNFLVIRGDAENVNVTLTGQTAGTRIVAANLIQVHGNYTGNLDALADVNTIAVLGETSDSSMLIDGNIARIALVDVRDTDIAVNGHLAVLTAVAWDAGSLTANSLGSMAVTEDYSGDLTVTGDGLPPTMPFALGALRIGGDLIGTAGRSVNIDGNVNGILVAGATRDHAITIQGDANALSLGSVDETTLEVQGDITRLLMAEWIGGSVQADTIAILASAGAFQADLLLAGSPDLPYALWSARILGDASGMWDIGGNAQNLVIAPSSPITGLDIDIEGDLASLQFTEAADMDLTVGEQPAMGDFEGGRIGRVVGYAWHAGMLRAGTAGEITMLGSAALGIDGDLAANIELTDEAPGQFSLNVLRVNGMLGTGDLGRSTVRTAGDVNAIVAGGLHGVNILVGPDSVPNDASDFDDQRRTLNFLIVANGPAEDTLNAAIAAWNIGRADLHDIDTDATGGDVGIRGHRIGRLLARAAGVDLTAVDLEGPLELNPDDDGNPEVELFADET